jgi:hypothetical protein
MDDKGAGWHGIWVAKLLAGQAVEQKKDDANVYNQYKNI